jgi:hypothetical protein
MLSRTSVACVLLVAVVSAASPVAAQVNVQLSGIVESVGDHTLTLITRAPSRRVIGASPAPAPPPTLEVDLVEVPASQWVFLRRGERIAVVGLPSADGRRFAAIAVIGGAGPRRDPQTP